MKLKRETNELHRSLFYCIRGFESELPAQGEINTEHKEPDMLRDNTATS